MVRLKPDTTYGLPFEFLSALVGQRENQHRRHRKERRRDLEREADADTRARRHDAIVYGAIASVKVAVQFGILIRIC